MGQHFSYFPVAVMKTNKQTKNITKKEDQGNNEERLDSSKTEVYQDKPQILWFHIWYLGFQIQRTQMAPLQLPKTCVLLWVGSPPVCSSSWQMSQASGIINILMSTNSSQALPLQFHTIAFSDLLAKILTLAHISWPQWLSKTMEENSMTSSIIPVSKTSITCRIPLCSATCLEWTLDTLDQPQLQQLQYAEVSGKTFLGSCFLEGSLLFQDEGLVGCLHLEHHSYCSCATHPLCPPIFDMCRFFPSFQF